MVGSAVDAGADLVLLPEVFATGFGRTLGDRAEATDGPTTRFMTDLATSHRVWLGGSVAIRPDSDARPVNRFLLVDPEGTTRHYDKRHLFSYAEEDLTMGAGEDVVTFGVGGLRVTPFVCYDLRFADDFWGVAPDTDLFVVVANWPARRAAHFRALLVARAIENQAYVVGVNRVGDAKGVAHDGGSVIVDPWGEIIVEAGETEAMIVASVDPEVVHRTRTVFPTFADRR